MYQSKTLRRMPPMTRKIARYLNDAEKSINRIKNMITSIQDTEREVTAWQKRQDHYKQKSEVDPINDWPQDSMLAKISKERS